VARGKKGLNGIDDRRAEKAPDWTRETVWSVSEACRVGHVLVGVKSQSVKWLLDKIVVTVYNSRHTIDACHFFLIE
jgi:hypothetical protein